MDWERLFHMADYHGISNIIYIALLGQRESIPEDLGRRFYGRYQEALHYSEIYEKEELRILQLFDDKKLPATVLESSATRRLYRIPETGGNSPLRLLLDPDSYRLAKGFLIDLDYETEETFQDAGESLRGKNGFHVEIYYTLPFKTKQYQKAGRSLLERAYVDQTFRAMHTFSLESSFVYRIAETCYQYSTDCLTIRKLLDTFLFFKAFREKMNMNFIEDRLQDFEIQDVAGSLIHVASAWFGSPSDDVMPYNREEIHSYDAMESRILSNGVIGEVQLPEVKAIRDELKKQEDKINREKEKEERKKHRFDFWHNFVRTLLWIFPGYRYMSSMYGILRYLPFLLPLFWLIRGIRMIFAPILPKHKKEQRPKELEVSGTASDEEEGATDDEAGAASQAGNASSKRQSITPYGRRAGDESDEKSRSGSAYATRSVLRSDAEERNADRTGPGGRGADSNRSDGRSADRYRTGSDRYNSRTGRDSRSTGTYNSRSGSGAATSGTDVGDAAARSFMRTRTAARYPGGTTGTGPISELPKETKTTMAIRENGRQAFRKDIEASAKEDFDEKSMQSTEQDANVKLWKFPTLEEAEKAHPIEAGTATSNTSGTSITGSGAGTSGTSAGSMSGTGGAVNTKDATASSVDADEVLGAHVRKWTFPTLDEAEKNS